MIPDLNGTLHLVNIKAQLADLEAISDAARVEDMVEFRLFTHSVSDYIVEQNSQDSLATSSFNSKYPTCFIIHGWHGSENSSLNLHIRKALLSRRHYNVFVVNWRETAAADYISASYSVHPVGDAVGQFIIFLKKHTAMALESVTVIGHSLGAHVAGFAGKSAKAGGKIGVIVGLDPAFPLFSHAKPENRLNTSDAIYVETIHTNAGLLGYKLPLGHASFFPNYGTSQPGCGKGLNEACAHSRAHELYAESITTKHGFWARRCKSYNDISVKKCEKSGADATMGGEPTIKNIQGVYWLETGDDSPYAKGPMLDK
ncbi:lipase member H-like [Phlebotomus argentipes]|uniref:lipase member H-like n=1 Tax=Phlebotomus argentipes TaxID=94469 RepID=UPI00289312B7|nr:lipase member H-like [Phlebotomus argentipes]